MKELEKAFSKCAALGLKFMGMDDSLYCIHKDADNAAEDDPIGCKRAGGYNPTICTVRMYDNGHKRIKARTYVDSGGW